MQSAKVRWGVLGTARIADVVIKGINMAANCELRAIASRDKAQAEAWAKERNVPLHFGSYDEMLASDEIDAVYIPLPNGLHKEWSIRAAQHGKHVLCEKPLATSAADVEEIIAAGEQYGVKIMEAFMYRFHPQMARMLEVIANGAIGEVKIIRATFGFYLNRTDDIRLRADLAGGSVMDVGCYCVNAVRLIAGAEPTRATASAYWTDDGVDLSLAGTLEFPGGVLGLIDSSFRISGHQEISVAGTKGHLSVPLPFRLGEETALIHLDHLDEGRPDETIEVPGAYEYHLMAESFARSVLENRPLEYNLQNSLGNMRAIEMLLHSARTYIA